jgi:hypothetical protein
VCLKNKYTKKYNDDKMNKNKLFFFSEPNLIIQFFIVAIYYITVINKIRLIECHFRKANFYVMGTHEPIFYRLPHLTKTLIMWETYSSFHRYPLFSIRIPQNVYPLSLINSQYEICDFSINRAQKSFYILEMTIGMIEGKGGLHSRCLSLLVYS